MSIISKLTARGRTSVPVEIRKKLGVSPGSALEWDERNGEVVVRRAGRYTSAEIHAAIFQDNAPKILKQQKAGMRSHVRRKHAHH